jgi:hypothetical protein
MTNKRGRGRWNPTPEQISVAVDCAVARMPVTRAAQLIGISPRTLRAFPKRIGVVPATGPRLVRHNGRILARLTAETAEPAHSGHPSIASPHALVA